MDQTRPGWARLRALLLPGASLKRWVLLLIFGVLTSSVGVLVMLRALFPPASAASIQTTAAVPPVDWLRGGALFLLGLGIVAAAVWQLTRSLLRALLTEENAPGGEDLMEALVSQQERRRRRTGPKIVVIGGGTGMPALLRGLRAYTENITAVVTVADDGGSSGRLRRQMGLLPPGDFRNNIAALSDAEDLMRRLLQYRFGDESGLGNHSFGNLFIATMAAITGSFETGIAESSRVLAVRGRILPSTLDHVVLCAEVRRRRAAAGVNGAGPAQETEPEEEWIFVRGESRIPEAGGQIMRVHLEPPNCRAYPETIRAILEADLILAAPGSFFTSLMPNLLVPNICKAIQAAKAPRIYICNVATQRGETDGFTVSDHMRQLRAHAGDAFTTVLANDSYLHRPPPAPDVEWVRLPDPDEVIDYRLFTGDLTDDRRPARHDSQKVAARVMEVYEVLKHEAEQETLP